MSWIFVWLLSGLAWVGVVALPSRLTHPLPQNRHGWEAFIGLLLWQVLAWPFHLLRAFFS